MSDETLAAKRDRVAAGFFDGWRQICADIERTPADEERESMRASVERLSEAEVNALAALSADDLAQEYILLLRRSMYEACMPENNPGAPR